MRILALALVGAIFTGPLEPGPEQQGSPAQAVPGGQTGQVPLVGTYWRLVGLADLKAVDQPGTREPHVIFHAAGSITGSDGCNTFRGGYTLSQESLKVGVQVATLASCALPDRLDRRFRELLVITRSWKIAEGVLTLLDDRGATLARFEARLDR
jgi:heat shock protein HslJ